MAQDHGDDIRAAVAALRRGDLDPEGFVAAVCDRIDAVDGELQAFVAEPDRRDRLRDEVQGIVSRWPDRDQRPPLFGVPVGVKDIIRVDGLDTRAGSLVDPAVLAGPQASIITRLRDAGAVIAGKTVTAEFANFAPGPTRNPHNPAHTPGGSSSGSAAAVAAGLVPVALGTQTVGSVIRPAAFCGVVGFKPTQGRVAVDGLIPHSPSLDTIGTFTPDVATAALVAPVVWSVWDADLALRPRPVLAVPEGPYLDGVDSVGRAAFTRQREELEDAGYEVRDVALLHDIVELTAAASIVNRYELAQTHAAWFDTNKDGYQERTRAAVEHGRSIDRAVYESALDLCRASTTALDERCDALGIDLLIAPSAPGPAPLGLDTTGDPRMNLPWTVAGRPALSLPAGTTGTGLPLGLQVVGRYGADEALVQWAAGIEDALDGSSADGTAPRPLIRPAPYESGGSWDG
jgi:Asp-tRNA(Asn)/Glu-tRNA(Gln) amidotransferase A subunit family amidase